MKKKVGIAIGVAALLAGCAAGAYLWLSLQEDQRDALIPGCASLPTADEVQNIYNEHPEAVAKLGSAGHFVSVEVRDHPECRDRAYILIQYDTVWTKNKIKQQLGPTFFGVPYALMNV